MVFNHLIGVRFPVGPPKNIVNYFVYIIGHKNKSKLTTYVGYTNNLKKRLSFHNENKGAKSTKGYKWKIIYKKKFSTKSKAMSYEYHLKKNRTQRKKIINKK